MMSATKLTLLVEKEIVEHAKRYSEQHGTSLSRLVSQALAHLPTAEPTLPPAVSRLVGLLPANVSFEEHRAYLRKKHSL